MNTRTIHFLDAVPFTLGHPGALELRDLLAQVYWRTFAVREIAEKAGVALGGVDFEKPMNTIWHELLPFLERALFLAPAIVKLTATCDSGSYYGTGFLIAKDLLLTNHHVLYDWRTPGSPPAKAVEICFDYQLDFDGTERQYPTRPGDVLSIKGDREHDFAVIRFENTDPHRACGGGVEGARNPSRCDPLISFNPWS
jgi:hypothetical protein